MVYTPIASFDDLDTRGIAALRSSNDAVNEAGYQDGQPTILWFLTNERCRIYLINYYYCIYNRRQAMNRQQQEQRGSANEPSTPPMISDPYLCLPVEVFPGVNPTASDQERHFEITDWLKRACALASGINYIFEATDAKQEMMSQWLAAKLSLKAFAFWQWGAGSRFAIDKGAEGSELEKRIRCIKMTHAFVVWFEGEIEVGRWEESVVPDLLGIRGDAYFAGDV